MHAFFGIGAEEAHLWSGSGAASYAGPAQEVIMHAVITTVDVVFRVHHPQ